MGLFNRMVESMVERKVASRNTARVLAVLFLGLAGLGLTLFLVNGIVLSMQANTARLRFLGIAAIIMAIVGATGAWLASFLGRAPRHLMIPDGPLRPELLWGGVLLAFVIGFVFGQFVPAVALVIAVLIIMTLHYYAVYRREKGSSSPR